MSFLAALVILEYFVKVPQLTTLSTTLSSWATTIAAFILVVGVINVLFHHYRVVKRREPKRWYFSAWVIFLIVVLLLYGIAVGGAYTAKFQWFWFMFQAWPYMCTLTVQALYQVSSAYRAFRARSAEATLLLIGAFILVLGSAPITGSMFPSIQTLSVWLSQNPAAAANRGITIGAGVGALALGFRILLGREKQLG